ncbi:hypothetical protein M0813_09795 [Anaeramoeba flamelloides]|uniref:Uncharacterized protein n=1 Tax=Anaeramoeba flamelloides TaxID=1746091 RepID=A0ABQ8X4T4_9EUKA|nr:hypothetical protein M0813_09795 [Anaeramoeba flamelloides]
MVTILGTKDSSNKQYEKTSLKESIGNSVLSKLQLNNSKIESMSEPDSEVIDLNCQIPNNFVKCVHHCFYDHLPLVLTPDIIWLLILQGFSTHINNNLETFRSDFTKSDQIENIRLDNPDLCLGNKNSPWEESFQQIEELLKEKIGNEFASLLTKSFSTTTQTIKTTYAITLMDITNGYYTVGMSGGCGIPSIKLEGTIEDWKDIRERIKILKKFELQWWFDKLDFVLKQFVCAFEIGNPVVKFDVSTNNNKEIITNFWDSIYMWNYEIWYKNTESEEKVPTSVTGWINVFFPYYRYKKVNLACKNFDWNKPISTLGIPLNGFPSGLSVIPFKYNEFNKEYSMNVVAGFMPNQQLSNNSLKAKIGWVLVY